MREASIDKLIQVASSLREPSIVSSRRTTPRVLVVDCFTGFAEQEKTFATPTSPILNTSSHGSNSPTKGMYMESRRRQFGSDIEILVRAICAERGWNAIISRRQRGCLSCAIREAGALGWKAIFRVEWERTPSTSWWVYELLTTRRLMIWTSMPSIIFYPPFWLFSLSFTLYSLFFSLSFGFLAHIYHMVLFYFLSISGCNKRFSKVFSNVP